MQTFTKKQISNLYEMFSYRKYTQNTKTGSDMLFFNDTVNNDNLICVKFIDNDKINVDNIRMFIAYLDKHDISHGIIICINEPSIQVIKEISTLTIFFEIFHANQLNINISKHSLVPIHTILSKEEADELKKQFSVTFAQFPKIKYSDAMARYIGAKVGQVVKIQKVGHYVTFRYVIKDKI